MGIYTDVMFSRGTADTSLTQMLSGVSATQGTYSPQLNGKLLKVDIILAAQAASSLCESGRVELSQTNWKPNLLRFPFGGFGLQTVAGHGANGQNTTYSYVIDQPVQTDWPITGNDIFFDSPVTPRLYVAGTFNG